MHSRRGGACSAPSACSAPGPTDVQGPTKVGPYTVLALIALCVVVLSAPWQSVETAVARVIGPTDVHVVNHHGSIDPESAIFLSTLRPPVLILPSWSATHPSQDALKRMMATRLGGVADYFGSRSVRVALARAHSSCAASMSSIDRNL